jgi:hypothetical protein
LASDLSCAGLDGGSGGSMDAAAAGLELVVNEGRRDEHCAGDGQRDGWRSGCEDAMQKALCVRRLIRGEPRSQAKVEVGRGRDRLQASDQLPQGEPLAVEGPARGAGAKVRAGGVARALGCFQFFDFNPARLAVHSFLKPR